jgi:DNA-binding CsgD family transcriptional regulator
MPLDLLTDEDRRFVLEIAWSLSGIRTDEDLAAAVMEVATKYIGADETGFNEINLPKRTVRLETPRPAFSEDLRECLSNVMEEHPVVVSLVRSGSLSPVRMSDCLPDSQFIRTRTYDVLFRPQGMRYQLNVPLYVNPSTRCGAGYALNRSDFDFSDRDVQRAGALQSVVTALHASLRARWVSPEQISRARHESGLSERELEVLTLTASGLTAVAAGRSLRISQRTVNKHLENAYRKLRVRDRMAAVAACRRIGVLP